MSYHALRIAAAMMPGEGAVMNGSAKPTLHGIERGAEIGAFGLDRRAIQIAHLADWPRVCRRRLLIDSLTASCAAFHAMKAG